MPAWSEKDTESLKVCWAQGMPGSKIGHMLDNHASRNAVIGKANRLGLTARKKSKEGAPSTRKSARPRKQKGDAPKREQHSTVRPIRHGRGVVLHESSSLDEIACESALDPADIPLAQRKQFFDLRDHHCRFPYGNPGQANFFFCGANKVDGSSYCASHASLCGGRAFNISDEERARRARWARVLNRVMLGSSSAAVEE